MVTLADLRPTHESFMYLERYVNGGSPSGFSFQNTPGQGFRALDTVESFRLPTYDCTDFGAVNVGDHAALSPGELPVHPEMKDEFSAALNILPYRYLPAAATSSGRTLATVADDVCFYAKVAYQRLLGRVTRKMTRAHVLSAVEVSTAYENAIAAGKMPATFHIYRERCGLYFPDATPLHNWGYVEREIGPYPTGNLIEVPAFSLTALRSDGRHSLLWEMLDVAPTLRRADGFFEYIVQPLIDLYFSSIVVLGLQPEAHAQNVVFLLDSNYVPVGIALRDMESVDKDVPLLDALGSLCRFTSTGYKFLSRDAYNYQIMHSFMFDFKFGEYLLAPLVDTWAEYSKNEHLTQIEDEIKKYVHKLSCALPDDFFPRGVWYDYEPVVHEGTSKRTYRKHLKPRFRPGG